MVFLSSYLGPLPMQVLHCAKGQITSSRGVLVFVSKGDLYCNVACNVGSKLRKIGPHQNKSEIRHQLHPN
jgi:hypothetical protein